MAVHTQEANNSSPELSADGTTPGSGEQARPKTPVPSTPCDFPEVQRPSEITDSNMELQEGCVDENALVQEHKVLTPTSAIPDPRTVACRENSPDVTETRHDLVSSTATESHPVESSMTASLDTQDRKRKVSASPVTASKKPLRITVDMQGFSPDECRVTVRDRC